MILMESLQSLSLQVLKNYNLTGDKMQTKKLNISHKDVQIQL
jgi:hypothetical protein